MVLWYGIRAYDFKTGKRLWATAIADPGNGESAPGSDPDDRRQEGSAKTDHPVTALIYRCQQRRRAARHSRLVATGR